MSNKISTTFIALALALATASAATAAGRHPVRHQAVTHTVSRAALQSYGSAQAERSFVAREPEYMRIQDQNSWGW